MKSCSNSVLMAEVHMLLPSGQNPGCLPDLGKNLSTSVPSNPGLHSWRLGMLQGSIGKASYINKKLGLRMSGTFLPRSRLQASTADKTLMKHKSRPSNNTHICQALSWLLAWKKDRSLNQLINYTSSNKVSLVKGSAGCPPSRTATSKPLILPSWF